MNRLLLSAPALLATTGAARGADSSTSTTNVNLLEIIKEGGIMMWPLGILSITAVVLILLFLLSIIRHCGSRKYVLLIMHQASVLFL